MPPPPPERVLLLGEGDVTGDVETAAVMGQKMRYVYLFCDHATYLSEKNNVENSPTPIAWNLGT